jgi:hypothetical protein
MLTGLTPLALCSCEVQYRPADKQISGCDTRAWLSHLHLPETAFSSPLPRHTFCDLSYGSHHQYVIDLKFEADVSNFVWGNVGILTSAGDLLSHNLTLRLPITLVACHRQDK